MNAPALQYPNVTVVVGGAAYAETAPQSLAPSPGHMSGQDSAQVHMHPNVGRPSGSPGIDAYKVAREFPDRWRAYVRTNFRNTEDLARSFDVCSKTARNWWNGVGGVNGRHVAVAVRHHPVQAPAMLFAVE